MLPTIAFDYHDLLFARDHNEIMFKRRGINQETVRSDSHLIGYLGQEAFRRYLYVLRIPYQEAPEDTGDKGDDYDFIVAGRKIDVKASYKFDEPVVSKYAAMKAINKNTLIVFVKMTENLKQAELVGYAEAKEFQRDLKYDRNGKEMYSIPKSKLKLFKVAIMV